MDQNIEYKNYQNLNGVNELIVNLPEGGGENIGFNDDTFKNANNITSIIFNDVEQIVQYGKIDKVTENSNPAKIAYQNGNYTKLFLTGDDGKLVEISKITITGDGIKSHSFAYIFNLKEIEIESDVTAIEPNVFYCCPSVKKITMPANVCANVMDDFKSTKIKVTINGGNYIPDRSFYSSNVESIDLSSATSLTGIGASAFDGCSALQTIILPASVDFIGDRAFAGIGTKTVYYIGTPAQWREVDISYTAFSSDVNVVCNYGTDHEKTISVYRGGLYYTNADEGDPETPYLTWAELIGTWFAYTKNDRSLSAGRSAVTPKPIPSESMTLVIHPEVVKITPNCFEMLRTVSGGYFDYVEIPSSVTEINSGAFAVNGTRFKGIEIANRSNSSDALRFVGNSLVSRVGDRPFITEVYAHDIEDWCNIDFSSAESNPISYSHTLYIKNGDNYTRQMVLDFANVTEVKQHAFNGLFDLIYAKNLPGSVHPTAFENCPKKDSYVEHVEPNFNNTYYYFGDTIYGYTETDSNTLPTPPVGVNKFAPYALSRHPELTSTNTSNVSSFTDGTLFGCSGLLQFVGIVDVDKFYKVFGDGEWFAGSKSVSITDGVFYLFNRYFPENLSVIIDNSETITSNRFNDIDWTAEITTPYARKIEVGAFKHCNKITTFNIPSTISEIESGAFMMMNGLTDFSGGSSNYTVTRASGGGGVRLLDVSKNKIICWLGLDISDFDLIDVSDTPSIGEYALSFNDHEYFFVYIDYISNFEHNAFAYSNFRNIEFANKGYTFDGPAFTDAHFERVTAPINIFENISLGNDGTGMTEARILNADSVYDIPNRLFEWENQLVSIDAYFGAFLQGVGERAFYGVPFDMSSIESFSYRQVGKEAFAESGITKAVIDIDRVIGAEGAFEGSMLTSTKQNPGVRIHTSGGYYQLPDRFFDRTSKLSYIKFYGTKQQWQEVVYNNNAFNQSSLQEVECDDGSVYYSSAAYVNNGVVIPFLDLKTNRMITITDSGVVNIESAGREYLKTNPGGEFRMNRIIDLTGATDFYTVGNFGGIEAEFSIGEAKYDQNSTFEGSIGLKRVGPIANASDFTAIPDNMLYGCVNLVDVFNMGGVRSVGNNAFNGCTSIEVLNECANIERIDSGAFQGCSNLTTISGLGSIPVSIGSTAFSGCSKLNLGVQEIPGTFTTISRSAFQGCSTILGANNTNLVIDNGVEIIDETAFKGCGFTSVEIPDSIEAVYYRAFGDSISNVSYVGTMDQYNSVMDASGRPELYDVSFERGLVRCVDGSIMPKGYGVYNGSSFSSFDSIMQTYALNINDDGYLNSNSHEKAQTISGIICFPNTVHGIGYRPAAVEGEVPLFAFSERITGVVFGNTMANDRFGVAAINKAFFQTHNITHVYINHNKNNDHLTIEDDSFGFSSGGIVLPQQMDVYIDYNASDTSITISDSAFHATTINKHYLR